MNKPVIMVVEDDPAIRRGLVDALDYAGYQVREYGDGQEALEGLSLPNLDLVLLDVLLPGVDGFQLLDEVRRRRPNLPVIMVTARGSESDRVHGLQGGADDYVVKPFSARELLARVEAVLRRSASRPEPVTVLDLEGCHIDLGRREVCWADGTRHALSERESGILTYLAGCRGRAISREEILQQVWGIDPRGLETRTVDMHVARLREKLQEKPGRPRFILTVRSKGYMLSEEVALTAT